MKGEGEESNEKRNTEYVLEMYVCSSIQRCRAANDRKGRRIGGKVEEKRQLLYTLSVTRKERERQVSLMVGECCYPGSSSCGVQVRLVKLARR